MMSTTLDYFYMEATERLERLNSSLLTLERSPRDKPLIDCLFRDAHSLKGAAGVSGLDDVAEVCHKMEDRLSRIRDGSETASPELIDALLAATDAVREMIAARVEERNGTVVPEEIIERLHNVEASRETASTAAAGDGGNVSQEVSKHDHPPAENKDERVTASEDPPAEGKDVCATVSEDSPVVEAVRTTAATEPPSPQGARSAAVDTVRLSSSMLETLGNRTGELMVAGDRLRQRLGGVRELHNMVRSERSRYHADANVQQAMQPIASALHQLIDDFTTDFAVLEPLIAEIHDGVLDTRMLPLSVMFDQFPRFIRDYCRQENKQAELHVEGGDTCVDRQVLEQLHDPMIHIIRNALSHGIESPEARKQAGKNPVGTVRLTTSSRGGRVRVTCEDDGCGINHRQVLARAVRSGMITEDEAAALPTAEIERLILRPGFSTAETVTDVSGRGVGMDVVVRRMEALRGTLDIESEPGRCARFVLEFPASVATLDGLLVEVAGFTYVVPTTVVVSTLSVNSYDLQTGAGGEKLLNVDGQAVPFMMLAGVLGVGECHSDDGHAVPAVILRHRDGLLALGVDRLLGTQTIVGKGLGDHIRSVPGVAGATLLGTGLPALILEPAGLVKDGGTQSMHPGAPTRATEVEEAVAPLLVVDDSITTRMMEQSILETAGYSVETAVSAEDALEKARNTVYRLFVVDVEMPGLNGFELTRRLRQDERFAQTPIIIVSSLAKGEHRLEGLDAGANAYIAKSEFNQNSLLRMVEKLVNK